MMPPVLVRFGLGRRRFWLPVILLWPFGLLGLAVALLLLPVLVLFRRGRAWIRFGWASYRMLCSLRGLRVDVASPDQSVHINIV